ncbi:MAG: hypothetical protein JNK79_10270 [Chitinophagaceae bacterium]|nr:hypothetical protein [Chitinophagaceae bacterium]
MILSDIINFFGRFHPLIVHLPIGIFLLAFFFDLISYHRRFSYCRRIVPLVVFTGFIFSILSVGLGFLLSFSGDYDRNTLSAHRTFGIVLMVFAGLISLLQLPRAKKRIRISHGLYTASITLMIMFLVYTGHQGANLTHGSDYINLRVLNEQKREKPQNVNEVYLYEDVVQPVLTKKCVQCHRQGKKKGRLSLESIADIQKGGKSGPGAVEGNAAESEIIKRVLLDPSHEDFMPADGKPPLTKNEATVLKWWIEKGMLTKGQKFVQLKNASEVTGAVTAILHLTNDNAGDELPDPEAYADIPDTIDIRAVENLREKGVNVRIMFKRPVMLDVTLPPGSKDKFISASDDLKAVAPNILWLNVSDNGLTAKELEILPLMRNLSKLRLEKNNISDEICSLLTPLTKLEAVNLNETQVTNECTDALTKLPAMKNVYSWRTKLANKLLN